LELLQSAVIQSIQTKIDKEETQNVCYYFPYFPRAQPACRPERFIIWCLRHNIVLSPNERKEWCHLHRWNLPLKLAIYNASRDVKFLIDQLQMGIRGYVMQCHWDYAIFCGPLYLLYVFFFNKSRYGHTIQTLRTDFNENLDTTSLQLPDNWDYGNKEELRITLQIVDESQDGWTEYICLLRKWLEKNITPWDETSPVYRYHHARFALQYFNEKYAIVKSAQGQFCLGIQERLGANDSTCEFSNYDSDEELNTCDASGYMMMKYRFNN